MTWWKSCSDHKLALLVNCTVSYPAARFLDDLLNMMSTRWFTRYVSRHEPNSKRIPTARVPFWKIEMVNTGGNQSITSHGMHRSHVYDRFMVCMKLIVKRPSIICSLRLYSTLVSNVHRVLFMKRHLSVHNMYTWLWLTIFNLYHNSTKLRPPTYKKSWNVLMPSVWYEVKFYLIRH